MQRRAQLGADGGPGADVGGQLGGGGKGRGLQRDRDQAMEILSTRRRCLVASSEWFWAAGG